MYITDISIPDAKLAYLLTPSGRNDKAGYLAQAGFSLEAPETLREAIELLVSTNEAVFDRTEQWGDFYSVTGVLYGPQGRVGVVTIWLQKKAEETYNFVTLKPD